MEFLTLPEANLVARVFGVRDEEEVPRAPTEEMMARRIVVAAWAVAAMHRDPGILAEAAVEQGTTTPYVRIMAGMNGSARQHAYDGGGDVWRVIDYIASVGLDVVLSDVRTMGRRWMSNVGLDVDEFMEAVEAIDGILADAPNPEAEPRPLLEKALDAARRATRVVRWERYTSPGRFARLIKRRNNDAALVGVEAPWDAIDLIVDIVAPIIPAEVRAIIEDRSMRLEIYRDSVAVWEWTRYALGEPANFVFRCDSRLPEGIDEEPPIAALAAGRMVEIGDGMWAFFSPFADRRRVSRVMRDRSEHLKFTNSLSDCWSYDSFGAYYAPKQR